MKEEVEHPVLSAEPHQKNNPARPESTAPHAAPTESSDQSGEKEELLRELTEIALKRTSQNQIQPEFRERLGYVLQRLTQIHKVSYTVLEQTSGVTRQNISKILKKYQREHLESGLPLEKGTNFAMKGIKESLESDLSKRASNITNSYLTLGKNLYEKYEGEALKRGYKVPNLVEIAVTSFLTYGDLYIALLETEQKNSELRSYVDQLENALSEFYVRNKKLKQVITLNVR